jgi:hypothetical protein
MSTSRLLLYNDALLICGERFISGLTEGTEPRRLLDHVWDNDGVRHCLEAGQWHFAMRAVSVSYNPSIEPDFGFNRAFNKPTDWVLTSALCSDEWFQTPLLRYIDEVGYWFSDIDTIYVKYVSDDASYGGDLSLWPSSFSDYVSAHFAAKIIAKLDGISGDDVKRVYAYEKEMLSQAKNRSAMAGPTVFPATGSWVASRYGGNSGERGNLSGNLIG